MHLELFVALTASVVHVLLQCSALKKDSIRATDAGAYIKQVDAFSVQHPLVLCLIDATVIKMGGLELTHEHLANARNALQLHLYANTNCRFSGQQPLSDTLLTSTVLCPRKNMQAPHSSALRTISSKCRTM